MSQVQIIRVDYIEDNPNLNHSEIKPVTDLPLGYIREVCQREDFVRLEIELRNCKTVFSVQEAVSVAS